VDRASKITLETDGLLGRICVEFQLQGDYYSHDIWLQRDDERIPILRSCEDPSRPGHPCFTQLHRQGKNFFLTGANGPCHWSMSVEVGEAYFRGPADKEAAADPFLFDERYGLNAPHRNRSDPAFHFLYFDVACRIKADVEKLGSFYAKSDRVEQVGKRQASSGQLSQSDNPEKSVVTYGANPDGAGLRLDPDPKCLVSRDEENNLRIYSSDETLAKYPGTVQWSYAFWTM
jgi:hypothetical protein